MLKVAVLLFARDIFPLPEIALQFIVTLPVVVLVVEIVLLREIVPPYISIGPLILVAEPIVIFEVFVECPIIKPVIPEL